MHIHLKTLVSSDYKTVIHKFDRNLFEALAPPFPKSRLLRFDGSKKGDEVHIELFVFWAWKEKWVSVITEDCVAESRAWFVDEGIMLPSFLSFWRHRHLIEKVDENSCYIVDDILFRSPFGWLIYPVVYLQFLYRKPIYRRYFNSRSI